MLKEHGQKTVDGRWRSTAAEKNAGVIWDTLKPYLPEAGLVTEIASGTGQHIAQFAALSPRLQWQPTEPDPDLRISIKKNIQLSGLQNIAQPISVNVLSDSDVLPDAKLIVNINMLHVSQPSAMSGLFRCVYRSLEKEGYFFLYGPFIHGGVFNSDGNKSFHSALVEINPGWGLREINAVITEAIRQHFELVAKIDMPANNTSLIFRKV
ncbi:MAG: hypothetical protein ACI9FB_001036 [Candidatus Azotimanducaceae bacterium]|jgi:hypothetical protein